METYSCGFCTFQSTDEHDYVRHYKKHTGVSPYHCQYCNATFNRNQHLTAHITREHTGAEFLNEDEAEISMEEMVGVGEISVSTSTRIQIDHPKMITLNRNFINENDSDSESLPASTPSPKKRTPGPASRTTRKESKAEVSSTNDNNGAQENAGGDNVNNNEEEQSFPMQYQGDLSSLFSTLGGSVTSGNLADIDGGMDLD